MPEPRYYLIVAYLLSIWLGVRCYFWHWFRRRGLANELSPLAARGDRWLAELAFVVPILVFLLRPPAGPPSWNLPVTLRLWSAGPASSAIVILFWSYRTLAAYRLGGYTSLLTAGPYYWVRHPRYAAHSLFFVSLAVITAEWLVLVFVLIGMAWLRWGRIPREEAALLAQHGAAYEREQARSGACFFRLARLGKPQYIVPRRFGVSAVMALLTTFGVLFGILNYAQAPPFVYLLAAFEIVAICLGQIIFGSVPRGISAMTGALLLPLCVALTTTRPPWMPIDFYVYCMVFLTAFGGLVGYCIGTLAAGFFLVMDLVDDYLPGGSRYRRT